MTTTPVTFNIYLVRPPSEADAQSLVADGAPMVIKGLDDVRFAVTPGKSRTPEWFSRLQPFVESDHSASLREPKTQLPGALLACRKNGRLFIVSFGAAHAQVTKSLVEPYFGRKVAMNAVPPSQVIELQSRQVFAAFHRLSERAPGATGHNSFGVEGDRDLVAAVEGLTSGSSALGKRVHGATSLSIDIQPASLPKALTEALNLFKQPNKFVEWSEFDNFVPVRDEAEVANLDAQLDQYLSRRPKDLVLAAPGVEALAHATRFQVGRAGKSPVFHPLLYPAVFYGAVNGPPTVTDARTTAVHFYDAKQAVIDPRKQTSIYDCICHEMNFNGRTFVLWSGHWYETNVNFVNRVQGSIQKLSAPSKCLPTWNQTDDEAAYNLVAGQGAGFKTLDRRLVFFGRGQSKFEFCDVVHEPSRTLYFVKLYTSSSTMSHLVEQVRRTAELFFSADPAYRKKMAKAGFKVPQTRPRNGDWSLCLVIMGRKVGQLPLFAQCSIARLVRDLERNQHSVAAQSV